MKKLKKNFAQVLSQTGFSTLMERFISWFDLVTVNMINHTLSRTMLNGMSHSWQGFHLFLSLCVGRWFSKIVWQNRRDLSFK